MRGLELAPTLLMMAASSELVAMSDVPLSKMAPFAVTLGTMTSPTNTPSSWTIQYLWHAPHQPRGAVTCNLASSGMCWSWPC